MFSLTPVFSLPNATPPGWTDDMRLTCDSANSICPAIATDSNGIHVVWKDNRAGIYQIYYKRSNNGGNTWIGDVKLVNDPAGSSFPDIVTDSNGIHVVWVDYRDGNSEIYYKKSSDGGNTWTGDKRLTKDSHLSEDPAIAIDRNGIHVVWWHDRDGNLEIYYKRSSDGGNTWTSDKRLTNSGRSCSPAIATDSNGIHVIWVDGRDGNSEIYYKKSSDGGNTWTGDKRLTSCSGNSLHPTIATDRNGIHVVWEDERHGNSEIYYKRSSDRGNTWISDVSLTDASAYSWDPAIATDSNGIHVVWYDDRHGYEIYYRKSSDGGNTWTGDMRLTNVSAISWMPDIATDSNGIHVVWVDWRDGNEEIYYK